jgi:hypothetical protein
MVKFEGVDHTCDIGVGDACVRMSWIPACSERRRSVWRPDYAGGDVWIGRIFRLVLLCSLYDLTANQVGPPGFVYGAFQSYARAFYAELLPPGEEARW